MAASAALSTEAYWLGISSSHHGDIVYDELQSINWRGM
jgi:hypothetical protein